MTKEELIQKITPYVTAYVPTFCIDYIEIPAPTVEAAYTRYTYRIPEQENIWEAYLIIYRRLRTLVDTPFKLDSYRGANVEDKRQWEILREALANLCMHTDHFSPIRSCIHAFTDKIEFMNAGNLPMQADQMARTFYSSLRNPTIAKLFRFANISENVGFGMGKLFSWKEITGNDVTFESNRNIVSICFYLKNNPDKSPLKQETTTTIPDLKDQQEKLGIKLGVNHSVNHSVSLEENKQSILLLVNFYPQITRINIAKILDITISTIDYHIRWLRKNGLLERVGADKNGYWKIKI